MDVCVRERYVSPIQNSRAGGPAPAGSACVFPFTYAGISYSTCTNHDNGATMWCYTDSAGSNWGNCDASCPSITCCSTLTISGNANVQTQLGHSASGDQIVLAGALTTYTMMVGTTQYGRPVYQAGSYYLFYHSVYWVVDTDYTTDSGNIYSTSSTSCSRSGSIGRPG